MLDLSVIDRVHDWSYQVSSTTASFASLFSNLYFKKKIMASIKTKLEIFLLSEGGFVPFCSKTIISILSCMTRNWRDVTNKNFCFLNACNYVVYLFLFLMLMKIYLIFATCQYPDWPFKTYSSNIVEFTNIVEWLFANNRCLHILFWRSIISL